MDEFMREETPYARKEHKCDLCYGTITKGEKYVHIVQSDSGDIFDSKYHTGCYDLVCRYVKDEGGYVDAFDEYNVIEDMFSITNNTAGELCVICKTGENEYKKHYIYLTSTVLYVVEDMSGADVSPYHYKVVFYPQMIGGVDVEVK